MKKTISPIIIGAGGVTSYLLPPLLRTYTIQNGLLIDGDILEKHNLDRQLFSEKSIGQNKAKALIAANKATKCFAAHPSYIDNSFPDSTYPDKGTHDILFIAVDNHPARRAALALARTAAIPVIIMANEYSTSQVLYWDPLFDYYGLDAFFPTTRFPEIATSNEGSPINCTGAVLESTPQLAMANAVSAALGLMVFYQWKQYDIDVEANCVPELFAIQHLPIELQTTVAGTIQSITVKDLLNQ